MGEIADSIVDGILFGGGHGGRARPRTWQSGSGNMCWRDRHGVVHDMREMTLAHLRAAAKKCRAEGNSGKLADIERAIREKEGCLLAPIDNP